MDSELAERVYQILYLSSRGTSAGEIASVLGEPLPAVKGALRHLRGADRVRVRTDPDKPIQFLYWAVDHG